jgi:hypothetical protein
VTAWHADKTISAAIASLIGASLLGASLIGLYPFAGVTLADSASVPTQPQTVSIVKDYIRQCMGCHGKDGLGAPPAVPRMAGFVGYYARSPEGRAYLVRVPGVANAPIDDVRLTALLNWTLETYSPAELPRDFKPFTTEEVALLRAPRASAPAQTRRTVLADLTKAGLIDPALVSATLGNSVRKQPVGISDTCPRARDLMSGPGSPIY